MTEYGKQIKKRLIDLEKPQKWLNEEVTKKTGMYLDDSYLRRICTGKLKPAKIIAAINEVLDIEQSGTKTRDA